MPDIQSDISCTYRVSVILPAELIEELGYSLFLREYEAEIYPVIAKAAASGRNTYSGWEEWAEFDNLCDAQKCRAALMGLAAGFTCKAIKRQQKRNEE